MIDHDPFIHLVAGRELGGLDDAEAIELDRHLVGCARCAAEVRAFGDTMAGLALVAPARHPPQSLQGSIMTAIRAVTPVPDPMPSRPATVMGSGLRVVAAEAGLVTKVTQASRWEGARARKLLER